MKFNAPIFPLQKWGSGVDKEKLLIEALLSHNGKAEIDNIVKYMKERSTYVTRGEIEDLVERSRHVIRVGDTLYLND